jgi:UDP-glucose 6-dehydrogenase
MRAGPLRRASTQMRVAMLGTGYVSLVSGAYFADCGQYVDCLVKDAGKIATLGDGSRPIYEAGLDELVAAKVKAGRLSFAIELKGSTAWAYAMLSHSAPRRAAGRSRRSVTSKSRRRRAPPRSTASPWS